MKKMFITIFGHLFSICLLCLLAYSAFASDPATAAVAATAYWVVMAMALFVGFIACAGLVDLRFETDPDKRERLISSLADFFKKRGPVRWFISWCFLAFIVTLLAYNGWVFTAVCYMLVTLITMLIISLGRYKLEELK
ncbi:hypothetical protein GWD52_21090 [Enterobacteriaceae bacterium 4M9]|nr:hypothetical protein [Enterobacteriaceae bacterium 4M9]